MQLFEITRSYDLVYKWFDHLGDKGHKVVGYVIMPNHIHALIAINSNDKSLNTIIGNAKRFLAYGIVERLKKNKDDDILLRLSEAVSASDKSKGKLHEVFEPSFDSKICYGADFVKQKLNYMHQNPVSKKWMLADDAIGYPHSSTRFYETGDHGIFEVANFFNLFYGIV